MTTKLFGFELLEDQVLDRLATSIGLHVSYSQRSGSDGDTPIETLFLNALHLNLKYCDQEWFRGLAVANDDEMMEGMKGIASYKCYMLAQRQVQLPGWRVDFLIHAFADWAREPDGGKMGWNKLIVECDGHDFHERTKEQAARDRERDRSFQNQGIEVFRFTGSELWRDPLGCADQVIKWGNRRV
jgi:hypothetical protein